VNECKPLPAMLSAVSASSGAGPSPAHTSSHLKLRSASCCSPRHPTHFEPPLRSVTSYDVAMASNICQALPLGYLLGRERLRSGRRVETQNHVRVAVQRLLVAAQLVPL
jgi:hypothetical protein